MAHFGACFGACAERCCRYCWKTFLKYAGDKSHVTWPKPPDTRRPRLVRDRGASIQGIRSQKVDSTRARPLRSFAASGTEEKTAPDRRPSAQQRDDREAACRLRLSQLVIGTRAVRWYNSPNPKIKESFRAGRDSDTDRHLCAMQAPHHQGAATICPTERRQRSACRVLWGIYPG